MISLDRIGSRQAGGEADAQTLDRFLTEWLVAPRLSHVRMIVGDAIEQVIGDEATEGIAESVPCFPQPVPEEVRQLATERKARSREYLDETS